MMMRARLALVCSLAAAVSSALVAPVASTEAARAPLAARVSLRSGGAGRRAFLARGTFPRGGALEATPAGGPTIERARCYLAATIALEILGTTSMKLAGTNAVWHIGTVVGYLSSFTLFTQVLKTIPLGVAYATWCGAGCALTYFVGVVLFKESITKAKLLSLATIVAGVVGLELSH